MAKKTPTFQKPNARRVNCKGVKDAASFFKNNYHLQFGAEKDGLHLISKAEEVILKREHLGEIGPRVKIADVPYRLVKYLKNDWHLAIGGYIDVNDQFRYGFVVLHTDAFSDQNPIFILSEGHLPVVITQDLKDMDTPEHTQTDYQTIIDLTAKKPMAQQSFEFGGDTAKPKLDIPSTIAALQGLIAHLQTLTSNSEKSST